MQLFGRRSSVFTRMPLFFAEALGVACELVPIDDMTVTASEAYAGNPALKLPVLRLEDGETVFGAQNICRLMAERERGSGSSARIVWPEDLGATVARNAQELVWHCMAAQVQIVMGTVIGQLPAEAPFFTKALAGLQGSLQWLDANVDTVLALLPPTRTLSLFEVSLFCLVEHLAFRPTIPVTPYGRLTSFAAAFGTSGAARSTAYRFDPRSR